MYDEVDELIYETEKLVDDFGLLLDKAESIYYEVEPEAQEIIECSMDYATQVAQNLDNFYEASQNFKSQQQLLNSLLSSRKIFLDTIKSGTTGKQASAIKNYFSEVNDIMGKLGSMQLNQFSSDFITNYFSKIPQYLNTDMLFKTLGSLSGSFEIPNISLPDIQIPKIGK